MGVVLSHFESDVAYKLFKQTYEISFEFDNYGYKFTDIIEFNGYIVGLVNYSVISEPKRVSIQVNYIELFEAYRQKGIGVKVIEYLFNYYGASVLFGQVSVAKIGFLAEIGATIKGKGNTKRLSDLLPYTLSRRKFKQFLSNYNKTLLIV